MIALYQNENLFIKHYKYLTFDKFFCKVHYVAFRNCNILHLVLMHVI